MTVATSGSADTSLILPRALLIRECLKGMAVPTFVETGTHKGKLTKHVAYQLPEFDKVYTVELSRELYEYARLQEYPGKERVTYLHGDSKYLVPYLCEKIEGSVFWYLDAHYCKEPKAAKGSFPLWDELTAIRDRGCSGDIILVDDSNNFGERREDLAAGQFDNPFAWQSVTEENILLLLGLTEDDVVAIRDSAFVVRLP